MKKFVLSLFLIGGFIIISFSQDIIVKIDGSTINCEIIEVVINSIKYKRNDNPNGPAYFIEKTEIAEIIYKNGSRDVFNMEMHGTTNSITKDISGNKKGYIAITLGPAFPTGDFGDQDIANPKAGLASTGFQLNLINFGYLFSENIGIAALWNGAAHSINLFDDGLWSYGGLYGGLLFSFPAEKVDFDIRLLGGFCSGSAEIPQVNYKADGGGFGFDMGALARVHLSQKTSFVVTMDYSNIESTLEDSISRTFTQNIENISLTVGIAFRLK